MRLRSVLLLLAAYLLPTVAFAAIEVKIARISSASVQAKGMHLWLKPTAVPGEFSLRGTLAQLHAGATVLRGVQLRCDRLVLDPERASCTSGELNLRLENEPLHACWSLQNDADGFELQLAPECASPIVLTKTASTVTVRATDLALEPLLRWLPSALRSGVASLKGQATLALAGPQVDALRGSAQITALGLELPARAITAEGVNARCQLAAAHTDCNLNGGAVLLGSAFIELPSTAVAVSFTREQNRSTLRWHDGETLRFNARWHDSSRLIQLALEQAALPGAYDRYLSSWAQAAGLPTLRLQGEVAGNSVLDDGSISALVLNGTIADASGPGWNAHNAAIALRYANAETGLPGALRISQLNAGGLALSDIDWKLRSTANGFALDAPTAVALLGGELGVAQLRVEPINQPFSASADLSLRALELSALSQLFGWRALNGTLSGEIPALTLKDDRLTTSGVIRASAFNGEILINGLGLERPFGNAPSLSANIDLRGIDLRALTSTYPIGEIRGVLDGHINALRLLNWQPTQFDLMLSTRLDGGSERTISQRAVSNLSSIGGGGPAAALQSGVLQFFKTFRYHQIGLQCRLERNVCTMDGVKTLGKGYAIVVGAGIPRVDVVGFERRVDFPLIVSRLSAAMAGQAPVIR